jgi:hypothetical protein
MVQSSGDSLCSNTDQFNPALLLSMLLHMKLPLEASEVFSLCPPDDQSGGSISEYGTKDIGLKEDLVADLEVEDMIGLVVCLCQPRCFVIAIVGTSHSSGALSHFQSTQDCS